MTNKQTNNDNADATIPPSQAVAEESIQLSALESNDSASKENDARENYSEPFTKDQTPTASAYVKPATPRTNLSATGITPSGSNGNCDCQGGEGNNENPAQLVYALGTLSFDFGTQARHDAIAAEIGIGDASSLIAPAVGTSELLDYLNESPYAADSIIWTLNLDAMPIYAIRAEGPFASQIYERLRKFLSDQIDPNVRAERNSIPGFISGSAMLSSGQEVPIINPEPRGMYNWTTQALINTVCGQAPSESKEKEFEKYQNRVDGVENFLNRVYYDVRNMGVDPRDRALNFAATNAFQIQRIFSEALSRGLELDQIEVNRSPICRMDSDCWDIVLYFYNPLNVLNESRRAYRFTADVSDIVPVLIGDVREWSVR